jgi:hypothetical protein
MTRKPVKITTNNIFASLMGNDRKMEDNATFKSSASVNDTPGECQLSGSIVDWLTFVYNKPCIIQAKPEEKRPSFPGPLRSIPGLGKVNPPFCSRELLCSMLQPPGNSPAKCLP